MEGSRPPKGPLPCAVASTAAVAVASTPSAAPGLSSRSAIAPTIANGTNASGRFWVALLSASPKMERQVSPRAVR
jgi:hypothetical protein